MGAGSCLIKTIFIITSTLNCVIGLLLATVGGAMLCVGIPMLYKFRADSKEDLQKIVDTVPPFLPEPYANFTLPVDDADEFVRGLATMFMFIGMFCVIFGITGCCSMCFRLTLIGYGVFSLSMAIVAAVLIGLYTDYIYTYFDEGLQTYHGIADTTISSIWWTVVMSLVDCCGLKDYTDFQGLPNWPTESMKGFVAPTVGLLEYLKLNDVAENFRNFTGNSDFKNDTETKMMKLGINSKLKKFKCQTGQNLSTVYCPWLDSSEYETPIACCQTISDLKDSCNVKNYTWPWRKYEKVWQLWKQNERGMRSFSTGNQRQRQSCLDCTAVILSSHIPSCCSSALFE